MTSLSDRLLVARPQWEAQLDAFHTLTTRALDSAEQLFALNMKTSRASIEQAAGTFQQMLHATQPRDLYAIGSQAQGQWQQVFSYSRELMGIAMGARQRGWSGLSTHGAPALLAAPVLEVMARTVPDTVENTVQAIDNTLRQTEEQATTAATGSATAATAAGSDAALAEDTLGVGDQSADGGDGTGLAPAGQIEPGAVSSGTPADASTEVSAAESAAGSAAEPAEAPAEAPTELDAEKTGAVPSETPDGASGAAQSARAVLDAETSANVDALVDIVIADAVPPAKAKPLVEALNEIVAKPAGAAHPIVSTVPLEAGAHVALPLVAPAEATPPVRLSNGPASSERRRSSRKKS